MPTFKKSVSYQVFLIKVVCENYFSLGTVLVNVLLV